MNAIHFFKKPYLARYSAALFTLGGLLSACNSVNFNTSPSTIPGVTAAPTIAVEVKGDVPPPAPREFRGAWVATVANIDWPSKKDLTVAQQKAEMIAILERAKALHLNAILLQVRPSADAIYPSNYEPWTEYLTGTQGKAPKPFYDPLKMWIDEAHARNIELHAWFNPYRAKHRTAKSPLAPNHIGVTHPGAVKSYDGYLWMDPGDAFASQRTLDVFLDVVRRYDVDGIHIDDYFYPYPIKTPGTNVEIDFPDSDAWNRYIAGGGRLQRANWRRKNVNDLIEKVYTSLHKEKAWVKFGISPIGMGRADRVPAGITGFSQYDKLYADAELWFNKGWLDYFTPQLYWAIDKKPQAYPVLLDYWITQNHQQRHLWPGMKISRIIEKENENDKEESWQPAEIANQIQLTRARSSSTGHVHFSFKVFSENRRSINELLKSTTYTSPALIPASPWLDNHPPRPPSIETVASDKGVKVSVTKPSDKVIAQYAVWVKMGNVWRFQIHNAAQKSFEIHAEDQFGKVNEVVISSVDRVGNESTRITKKRGMHF
ncbi:glycoside hydrolase family 10 protein [Massilia pseudoviolaceinigra]|uniref:glycoside hydrolase family 10 protein n=1 Tax=Massilia pseudoviolaceinigra TaxID=3057165 RepID=UPI0027963F90|nr:family 10 glycosylhydrolase [Massilia sp. CCM 9206]MDQ1924841.1 family 10 glycosylhydrolase [Massilia sp. CCM 9206]